MNFLWVAIGGSVGAVARYGTGVLMKRITDEAAWSTLSVNLIGSFVIGILWTATATKIPEQQKMLIFTGFLGAFTTFSTFNLDIWRHLSEGKHMTAVSYISLSIIGGLALVLAGCKLGTVLADKANEKVPVEIQITDDNSQP